MYVLQRADWSYCRAVVQRKVIKREFEHMVKTALVAALVAIALAAVHSWLVRFYSRRKSL